MKWKIDDLVEEDHESDDGESDSSGDESEDEELRIKDVLSHLFQVVFEKRASEFFSELHEDNYFEKKV